MEWIGDLERAFAAVIYPNRVLIALAVAAIAVGIGWIGIRRRWHVAARRNPRRTAAVLLPALAIALPLGWYLGSPLVLSSTIDEPAPVVGSAGAAHSPIATASPAPTPSVDLDTASPIPTAVPTAEPIVREGKFKGADDFHTADGVARLIETEPGVFVVRLEDFAVRNGPDLYVYLSPKATGYADGAIELGRLKADKGNQNYRVPAGTDVTSVESVVIWCRQFSVLFGAAPLGD